MFHIMPPLTALGIKTAFIFLTQKSPSTAGILKIPQWPTLTPQKKGYSHILTHWISILHLVPCMDAKPYNTQCHLHVHVCKWNNLCKCAWPHNTNDALQNRLTIENHTKHICIISHWHCQHHHTHIDMHIKTRALPTGFSECRDSFRSVKTPRHEWWEDAHTAVHIHRNTQTLTRETYSEPLTNLPYLSQAAGRFGLRVLFLLHLSLSHSYCCH